MVIRKRKLTVKATQDKNGKKGVFIPSSEWRAFKKEIEFLKKSLATKSKKKTKTSVLNDLKEALLEVSDIRSGKSKAKTVKDFLREL